jgi:hypothetical protein|tara:strand:- start:1798 stop:2331 length:534 start_codon:yes stop_codon:yes gene_type:complete
MNIKGMLINKYTVGGSLLLVGAGFFSTRFTDALSYQLFTLPAGIPMIGGASVTVGRVAGLVPLSLGLAFILSEARPITSRIPVVDRVAAIADDLVGEISEPVSTEASTMGAEEMEAETVDQINPTEVAEDSETFEAEGGKMKWTDAVSKARKELGITGFSPVKKGTPLYKRAKQLSA